MRTDVVRTYKDIHSWVGIVAGLALFIAFYAGAITMFEEPLQRWASPPTELFEPVPLDRTPALIAKVLAEHPEARTAYRVHLATGPEQPARVSWTTGDRRNPGPTYYASLAADRALQVSTREPSPVAQLVDILHQQVGLPFPHEIAMPIMGTIALLYAVALISGVICLLPSLIKDLFALRFGRNLKRMWLDLHNVLGLFSLPFHIVMALTAVIFAFHDQFYDVQRAVQNIGAAPQTEQAGRSRGGPKPHPPELGAVTQGVLPPAELVRRVEDEMPGFRLSMISYEYNAEEGPHGHIQGNDPRYGLRGPTYGLGEVDTRTGKIIEGDYLPGKQGPWFATISSFFAAHFGNYGGAPVRWSYFILGLAGAFLFYTGNLLWIESRRKKERKAGPVEQTRSTRILGALTVGVPLGCMAGISLTVAAAKPLGIAATETIHSLIYYGAFLAIVGWALLRGAARAGVELLYVAAASMFAVPLATLLSAPHHPATVLFVDATAVVAAVILLWAARASRRRSTAGPRDSVWAQAGAVSS